MRKYFVPQGFIFQIPNPTGIKNLADLVDNLISLAFFAVGLGFFINLIIGGFQWMSSSGDPKSLQTARGRITNSLIGLIIVIASFSIALIVETVLGIRIVSGFCIQEPCP